MSTPLFTVTQNEDGTLSTTATANATSINWAALFQAVVAALPAILAILAAFTGQTPVPPAPPAPHA